MTAITYSLHDGRHPVYSNTDSNVTAGLLVTASHKQASMSLALGGAIDCKDRIKKRVGERREGEQEGT